MTATQNKINGLNITKQDKHNYVITAQHVNANIAKFWKEVYDTYREAIDHDADADAAFSVLQTNKTFTKIGIKSRKGVTTLGDYVSRNVVDYDDAYYMFFQISRLFINLAQNCNLTVAFFDIDDFVVCGRLPIFVNQQKLCNMSSNGNIRIDYTPNRHKNHFMSPEVYEITEIPCEISAKSYIFSLALLVTSVINYSGMDHDNASDDDDDLDDISSVSDDSMTESESDHTDDESDHTDEDDGNETQKTLGKIFGTPLYWCLLRCLQPANKRALII